MQAGRNLLENQKVKSNNHYKQDFNSNNKNKLKKGGNYFEHN